MSAQTHAAVQRFTLALNLVLLVPAASIAAVLPTAVPVQGEIVEDEDLSAVAATERFLLVASDERGALQVLGRTEEGFEAGRLIQLLEGEDDEADLEGIAIQRPSDGPLTVFAIGCHCQDRDRLRENRTVAQNLERLGTVEREVTRAFVFRLSVDPSNGNPTGEIERRSLAPLFQNHRILSRFTEIPSKENGIDIEGLAVGPDGRLFVGFRGPVLRGNFVPVLVFGFDQVNASDVRFLNLEGLGIRDIAAVRDGFLVLAGPVGEGRPDFRIFFWDGMDAIPGTDRSRMAVIRDLGDVPVPGPEAKAEGLTVISEDDRKYEVLLIFDGIAGGRPTRLTVDKQP